MITINNDIKEKKKQRKKYLTPCAAVLLICSLAACAGGGAQKNAGGDAGAARTAETEAGTEENVSKQEAASLTGEETANSAESAKEETQTPVTESRAQDWSALPNPIVDVGSSEDFEAAGLRLWLPANKEWYSDPDYSMIGDKAAQIQFYDEITKSDAIARAAKSEEGDISGIYYVFDDSRKQSWFTKLEDGTKVDITVRVTSENSDVHGVLATWSAGDTSYSLWEDDAWEHPDAVAKMAIEIIKMSDPGRETEQD